MPICPECRQEFEPGVVICRDCRASLVDDLERAQDVEWLELVPLSPVANAVSGAMLLGALESQGLHPVLRSHAIPAYGEVLRDWNTKSWGTLLVPQEERTEARLVLEDFIETARDNAPASDEEADVRDEGDAQGT